ncbi:hypothetical protein [Isachenkonia alkalipeptolytica]|uniref:DNA-binding protein n=1 Tax=Isachenkonia alkalipeptolytica TaxID=2565777 RepID=A0AA43XIP0_9CLOT|nr:hypothetical protein [Isachenkonia alkalipeptolytica]NBG87498.1 hypothetical protein [Isachenkonia alkalipeptolytica]
MPTEVNQVQINGKELTCPVCDGKEFWKRRTLMNTPGASFMGFDWANKEATNFVCNDCGYVFWFLKDH